MDKIAVGPGLPAGVIDLDKSPSDNVKAIAKARGVSTQEVSVCVLERERHEHIVADIRTTGARVMMIPDGDVAGVISTTDAATGIDMYVGQGGAPEGVLAATALRCVGGQMQARLFFRNDDERARAAKTGITDLDRKYDLMELASSDCLFVATGVTEGSLVEGVRRKDGTISTETLLMSSAGSIVRRIKTVRPA